MRARPAALILRRFFGTVPLENTPAGRPRRAAPVPLAESKARTCLNRASSSSMAVSSSEGCILFSPTAV